jgi:hypothetical protein
MEQTRNTYIISVFVVSGKIIITKQGVKQWTGLKRLEQVPIGPLAPQSIEFPGRRIDCIMLKEGYYVAVRS